MTPTSISLCQNNKGIHLWWRSVALVCKSNRAALVRDKNTKEHYEMSNVNTCCVLFTIIMFQSRAKLMWHCQLKIMLYFFPDQEIDAAKIIDKLRYVINTIYSTKAKALKIRKCVLRTVQILYVLGVLYMNYTIRFSGPLYWKCLQITC